MSIKTFEKHTQIYKIRALTKVKSKFSKCLLLKRIREKDAVEQFAKIKIIATFVALRDIRCAEARIQIKNEGVVFACDSFVFYIKTARLSQAKRKLKFNYYVN